MSNKFKNLIPEAERVFKLLGFTKIDQIIKPKTEEVIRLAKPYYANADTGKIYRVIGSNKLKAMSDNSRNPEDYCNTTLTIESNKYVQIKTHRLIMDMYSERDSKRYLVHHKNRNRQDNRLINLRRANAKENAQEREKAKRSSRRTIIEQ